MDYVVGSIAALLSGNVTPNRPKQLRTALTPMKHQPSPNVTPKSEFVEDRSIFLSPTMQKKKAIVKKSPKRIFQNPDPDVTNGEENDSSFVSPKADKVKKHLKEELEADSFTPSILLSPKSLKNSEMSPKKSNKKRSSDNVSDENVPKKKQQKTKTVEDNSLIQNGKEDATNDATAEKTPKKKVKGTKFVMEINDVNISENIGSSKKKNKQQNGFTVEPINISTEVTEESNVKSASVSVNQTPKKNKKRRKNKSNKEIESSGNAEPNQLTDEGEKVSERKEVDSKAAVTEIQSPIKKKKNRRSKKKSKQNKEQIETINNVDSNTVTEMEVDTNNASISENTPTIDNQQPKKKKNKKKKSKQNKTNDQVESGADDTINVNPNAVTNQDTDSEHDSDDEIDSENEEVNKEVLGSGK